MKTIIILLLFANFHFANAQKCTSPHLAIAARYGSENWGASISYHTQAMTTVEGIFTISHDRSRYLFTALFEEKHLIGSKGFYWYGGAGAHIGKQKIWNLETVKTVVVENELSKVILQSIEADRFIAGADLIFGIDYRIKAIPVIIGLNFKPFVDFINSKSDLTDVAAKVAVML